MEKQTVTITCPDMAVDATDGVMVDKLTGYPVQIWEQAAMPPMHKAFLGLYLRDGKWRKCSPQMLDRVLRAIGLPGLTNAPWGSGLEVVLAIDDVIAHNGGAPRMSETLRVSRETES